MKNKNPDLEKRAQAFFKRKRHDTTTPLCLIIDGMNIAYQAFYAYLKLSHQGKSTSIRFGFPQILKGILQMYKAEKIIVCWDGEKHPKRMELLPNYKGHREKGRDPKARKKFIAEIKSLRYLLKTMGIPQAYNPHMEGDDMIYWVHKTMQPFYRIMIITADKDMHQLINYDTTVYNPRNKIPYSNFAYICDHLVEPYQFVDYLCLVGDTSDDIPGYRGIGPAKASQFFKQFKGIEEYLKSSKDFAGLVDKEKLKEVWERNRLMLDLKYFNEQYHTPKDILYYKNKRNPIFNEAKFTAYCLKYGLKTMTTETFKRPFINE